ncbi:GTP-binding domain protein [Corynebacterium genitalium ATCC 33030]|uniref:GTP-binding domain protein n=1 Tax=Corynebacterium genitalium ATCC 33030 TaxID=585529 RepID=D7W9U2_9CORY|nr:GTP-binding domain protein [Corynebacterium genitalium ATCC 33030]
MEEYAGVHRRQTGDVNRPRRATKVEQPWEKEALVGSYVDREVVFLGPVGVGKTTAISTLSTLAPVQTEVYAAASDDFYVHTKTTTTVGIDFGMWHRPDGRTIGLYGTPGQERFQAARGPAMNPEAGLVLWLFGYEHLLEDQVSEWIMAIHDMKATNRVVVAVNFKEPGQPDPVTELRHLIPAFGFPDVPIMSADPRKAGDVAAVVDAALNRVGATA